MEFKRTDSVAASACCMCMKGIGHQPAIVRYFDVICISCAQKIATLLTTDELEYVISKLKKEKSLLTALDELNIGKEEEEPTKNEEDRQLFVCSYCGKKRKTELSLQNHLQTHRIARALDEANEGHERYKNGLKAEVLA